MFGEIKRIAVCFSGQARTWRTAKDNIFFTSRVETSSPASLDKDSEKKYFKANVPNPV